MAGTIGKLTALAITQAKRRGYYGDGGGLFLQVSASGAKSWVFRFKESTRLREMGLGPTHTVSLAEARQKALECRKARLDGLDPIEARRGKRIQAKLDAAKAMTFAACAESYIASHRAGWRNPKHAAQWPATLCTYVYPVFGSLPVQAVDVGLVMKAIEPIWTQKPETAGRVRGRIESVLDWAAARGYRQGENPARWRGHLENLLPKKAKVRRVEHHAALPYAEISAFVAELRQQDGVAARALEFAILTAARTGEVIGAKWDEIDVGERLWTVPAERMKAGKEHRVPLSDAALAILEGIRKIRQGDQIFPGSKAGRPISNMAMLMLLRRMGRGDLTAHGFRSSFRDWVAERTTFPAEVAEMALAHAVADKVEAAYRRGDLFQKRRQLADAWAKFCAAAPAAGQVVPIRKPTAAE
ncbi:MAG TPA: integrase arm-type DNA-binding domain-containing protein [Stellaceae bacterium]|nr:integrase arm-type DNA-binding domain-containing protein [Stellaceae bacterium]